MRILWGALRAVSVETMGVLVVLWMLHGATGLAIDAPWRAAISRVDPGTPREPAETLIARPVPVAATTRDELSQRGPVPDAAQRASVRQWFNTLFPAGVDKTSDPPEVEQRVEFTRERLDHYGRLYGIASRE